MTAADERLLSYVIDDSKNATAFNLRKNGQLVKREISDNVTIVSKADGTGIDIFIKEKTKRALVMIPVIITETDIHDKVYNDFHVGKNATATIIAGCAIHNPGTSPSTHNGIHRFFLDENSNITYLEKHYGEADKHGSTTLDPITEIYMEKNSQMKIDTLQIKGVNKTTRYTIAEIKDGATLVVNEKIMTNNTDEATTEFDINLNGKKASAHVTSRSVATDNSVQTFISRLNGNNECYGHVECDGILKDKGIVRAIPEVNANHLDSKLIHEATIGKIAGEQLIKLMSLGLNEKEAEEVIINGFLK